jgi:hypothetical protein
MEQKQLRLEVSQDVLDYANSDPDFWLFPHLKTQLKGT